MKKIELAKQVVKSLGELLKKPCWKTSMLNRVIYKKIQHEKAGYDSYIESYEKTVSDKSTGVDWDHLLANGFEKVYVIVYNSQGSKLSEWERLLMKLPFDIIGRPVFSDEEQARVCIEKKLRAESDGYVELYVEKRFLTSSERSNVLRVAESNHIAIDPKGVQVKYIASFVHMNLLRYKLDNHRLVRIV